MSDNDNRKLIQLSLEIQIHGLAPFVTVHKSMCPIHSEAKQMEMSAFWANKGLLQEHRRRTGGLCSQNPKLPEKFQQSIFKGQVRERNPRVWNLSTAEIIYFLCCTSRHANEEHQTTGSLSFFSLGLQGKSPCSTHVDLSPFSQWFLQHMVFLLKSSVLSRRDQCQSSSPMAHEEEVRSNSTTCLFQLWSWISLLRDCSGGLST